MRKMSVTQSEWLFLKKINNKEFQYLTYVVCLYCHYHLRSSYGHYIGVIDCRKFKMYGFEMFSSGMMFVQVS